MTYEGHRPRRPIISVRPSASLKTPALSPSLTPGQEPGMSEMRASSVSSLREWKNGVIYVVIIALLGFNYIHLALIHAHILLQTIQQLSPQPLVVL
jgi:hypothetical protein